MRYFISLASGLAARWQIGDEVFLYLGPLEGVGTYLNIPADDQDKATRCKVVGVKFEQSKVLYDLAPWMIDERCYYEARPLMCVDSSFVHETRQEATRYKNLLNPNYRESIGETASQDRLREAFNLILRMNGLQT